MAATGLGKNTIPKSKKRRSNSDLIWIVLHIGFYKDHVFEASRFSVSLTLLKKLVAAVQPQHRSCWLYLLGQLNGGTSPTAANI